MQHAAVWGIAGVIASVLCLPPCTTQTRKLNLTPEMGGPRRYLIDFPHDVCKHGKPAPVIFSMHGFGSRPDSQREDYIRYTPQAGFILVSPAANLPDYSWNGGACCGIARKKKIDDYGFLNAIFDDIIATFNVTISKSSLFGSGHSNGGFISSLDARREPRLFAAVSPSSGLQFGLGERDTGFDHQQAILAHMGVKDHIISFEGCCEKRSCCCGILVRYNCTGVMGAFDRRAYANKCDTKRGYDISIFDQNTPMSRKCYVAKGCLVHTELCAWDMKDHSNRDSQIASVKFFAEETCRASKATLVEPTPLHFECSGCPPGTTGRYCLEETFQVSGNLQGSQDIHSAGNINSGPIEAHGTILGGDGIEEREAEESVAFHIIGGSLVLMALAYAYYRKKEIIQSEFESRRKRENFFHLNLSDLQRGRPFEEWTHEWVVHWGELVCLPSEVLDSIRKHKVDGFLLSVTKSRAQFEDLGVYDGHSIVTVKKCIQEVVSYLKACQQSTPNGEEARERFIFSEHHGDGTLTEMEEKWDEVNSALLENLNDLIVPDPEMKSVLRGPYLKKSRK
ncbi:hypothetical protein AAMO2058_000758200 [Amorphochlora amoebiformis]